MIIKNIEETVTAMMMALRLASLIFPDTIKFLT